MALVEFKLHVAYALLHSDWLAQNLELESGNPGRSTHTYSSFPPPSHLRTRMRIRGKICLVRETSVRACVFVCVWLRVCVCFRACLGELPLVWACLCVFNNLFCVCAFVCLLVRISSCTHSSTLSLTNTRSHSCIHAHTHALVCMCVRVCVHAFVL